MTEQKINEPTKGSPKGEAGIGHNSGFTSRVQIVPLAKIEIWLPAQEQANDVLPDVIEEEVGILAEAGQRAPVPARRRSDGRIEVVASAHVVTAVSRYIELNPERRDGVEVRVFERLDDAAAYRLLAQQIEPAYAASSLARGQFYMRAVEQFGNEAEAAKACRTSKASVSKNLDVVRACAIVGDKVLIRRDIAQRPASWLMGVVGREPDGSDAPDPAARSTVLAALDHLDVAPASRIFAALRAATKIETPRRAGSVLSHGGREIGHVRHKKDGAIRIDLDDLGDTELEIVVELIREKLASALQASSF